MNEANNQHVKHDHFRVVTFDDGKVIIQIIAGELDGVYGRIQTQTPVNAFMVDIEEGGMFDIKVPNSHQSIVYLLKGNVLINYSEILKLNKNQWLEFNEDGAGFSIKGNETSKLLFLSGEPFNKPVTTYGPYAMHTQTEIMEAMRDYQMGEMGFLTRN